MKFIAWLLYALAVACVAAGLIVLSPPLALVALGVLLGRVAYLIEEGST